MMAPEPGPNISSESAPARRGRDATMAARGGGGPADWPGPPPVKFLPWKALGPGQAGLRRSGPGFSLETSLRMMLSDSDPDRH